MSYFTDQDLLERLRGTGVEPVAAEILAARAFAESYVDASLTGRYRVPFDPVPDAVRFVALDIAAYEVLSKHFTAEDPNVGDLLRSFWSRATESLRALAEGRMDIRDVARVDEPTHKGAMAARGKEDAVFRLPDKGTGETGSMEDW